MALKIGNNAVANAFVGSSQVRRAYKGGTLVYQGFGPASEQEFIQQEAAGGPAELSKIYGKSVIWRQYISGTGNAGGLTITTDSNGVIHLNGTTTALYFNPFITSFGSYASALRDCPIGRYIEVVEVLKNPDNIDLRITALNSRILFNVSGLDTTKSYSSIGDCTAASSGYMGGYGLPAFGGVGTVFNDVQIRVCLINLTDLYGSGNEPTTVAQFEADYPTFNPTYDPGSLQSNKTAELRAYDGGDLRGSLALNLSTLTGKLNGEGASVVVYPDGLRGVGTDRDAAYGSTGEVRRAVVDLGSLGWGGTGTFFSSVIGDMKSDSSILGMLCAKYKPRDNRAVSEDKAYYRDGGRIFIQDSAYATAADFKAAVSGVEFEYPLATPLTYTLDTPLPTDLTCEQGDKLQRVSDNNCPFVGEMKFGL